MIYFIDFDLTFADTSICRSISNYKEKEKYIPRFKIYEEAIELVNYCNSNSIPLFIVSGNVGSLIKKVIKHFNIPIEENNVIGYRRGMPMENLKRKIAVINFAIKHFNLNDRIEEIVYIGDEEDDKKASETVGIKYEYPKWRENNRK